MRSPGPRGFRLVDVMILIAATAAGCSLVDSNFLRGQATRATITHDIYDYQCHLADIIAPIWLSWTFAAPMIALRPPRPASRRLARQPGLVASLAVVACTPFVFAESLMHLYASTGWPPTLSMPPEFLPRLRSWVAFVVIGSWLTLFLVGRWRPEPSAIDRFGRVLGFGWIAFFVVHKICFILMQLGLGQLY